MIDTIKLLIPVTDPDVFQKLEGTLMRFRKENLNTGQIEFEFHTANIELGTYHRTVAVRSSSNPEGFFIEFSVPKYAKGNNVEMIHPSELPSIMDRLYVDLCEYMNHELPQYSSWLVYKLDACYNWILKDESEAQHAIDFIRCIDYPKKKRHDWATSVLYQGTAYSIKFYMKGAEFYQHDFKKVNSERAPELQAWANRILRFEVTFRRVYLEKFFGLDTVYVANLADDWHIQEILVYFLQKVFFYINPITTTNEAVREILYTNFSRQKATRLFQFYRGFYFDDEMKAMFLRGGMNRSTIYRYKKDLKRVGIGFTLPDVQRGQSILEQLVIPSSNSQFDLVDYPFPEL